MFYNDVISKDIILKNLWNFIKSVFPSKHLTPPLNKLDVNDTSVKDPTLIYEFFHNYFVKIGQTIAENTDSTNHQNFKSHLRNSVSQSTIVDPLKPNEIYNIINSLNLHKATGHNIISSYLLCMGNDVFALFLSHYFELAFELGICHGV